MAEQVANGVRLRYEEPGLRNARRAAAKTAGRRPCVRPAATNSCLRGTTNAPALRGTGATDRRYAEPASREALEIRTLSA